jgi:hypothetical protein
MRLVELFLNETTEEDRAIISLSSAIYKKLEGDYIGYEPDYTDEDAELIDLGKIGNMFNTPIPDLDNIGIELQGGEEFLRRADRLGTDGEVKASKIYAFWDDDTRSVVLNLDFLDHPRMRTVITHELRHALDDVKSGTYPASPKNKSPDEERAYFRPRKKEHRKLDPYSNMAYRAQPAEINARFTEVLDELTVRLPRLYARFGDQTFDYAVTTLNNLLKHFEIADIFPEKEQSRDYKRLMKRAADLITKELDHIKSKQP